ncbi:MAG TPA: peptide chain release factor N(5)-glutamine methyltransferase [Candidatus Cybelea sp.]
MTSLARADAALILGHVLGRDRSWLVAHPDAQLSDEEAERFESLCARRREGTPVAYLIGTAGFYGREFLVDENVLVPRPETEHLIDEALAFIRPEMRVLDVGTGSGAIACTIAAQTRAHVDAVDLLPAAVEIAVKNARRLGVAERCKFYVGDLLDSVRRNRYDVVIANLPYIPTGDLPKPPDPASFEPQPALDGGPDGLSQYRRLMPGLPELINEGGMVLLECAPPTFQPLKALVQLALPNFVIEGGKDYSGLDRYVQAYDGAARDCYVPVEGRLNPSEATDGESSENRATGAAEARRERPRDGT